jgi:hypothetical protein
LLYNSLCWNTYILAILTISKFLFPDVNNVYHAFIAGLTLGIIVCFLYPFLLISKINAPNAIFFSALILGGLTIILLKKSIIKLGKIKKIQAFLWISIITNVIFVFYYDAFKNISPSNVDTLSNYYWIKYKFFRIWIKVSFDNCIF